ALSQDCDPHTSIRHRFVDDSDELPRTPDPLAIEIEDDVAVPEASLFGGRPGLDLLNDGTPLDVQPFGRRRVDISRRDADIGTRRTKLNRLSSRRPRLPRNENNENYRRMQNRSRRVVQHGDSLLSGSRAAAGAFASTSIGRTGGMRGRTP